MAAALRPLRLPAFRRLATANLVDELGDWLGEIALAVLVFDQTGSPIATAALFLALQFVPALADTAAGRPPRAPARARSLSLLYATEAAVFAALALLATDFLLAPVLALAALDGALASSARSLTRAAAAGALKPPGLLREGNAVLNIGFTAGAAVGPALAGLVVAGAERPGRAVRRRGLVPRRRGPAGDRSRPPARRARGRRASSRGCAAALAYVQRAARC